MLVSKPMRESPEGVFAHMNRRWIIHTDVGEKLAHMRVSVLMPVCSLLVQMTCCGTCQSFLVCKASRQAEYTRAL